MHRGAQDNSNRSHQSTPTPHGQLSPRLYGIAHRAHHAHAVAPAEAAALGVLVGVGMAGHIAVCGAGSKVPVSFTLKYAAPETVQAFTRGREAVVADTAVDMFAFGIMCFELLTRRPYYPKECSGQEVGEMLSGSRRLPHESMDDATARRLGVLRSCAPPLACPWAHAS